jgi:hypothetical protein
MCSLVHVGPTSSNSILCYLLLDRWGLVIKRTLSIFLMKLSNYIYIYIFKKMKQPFNFCIMYTTSKLLECINVTCWERGTNKTNELETKSIYYCVSIPNLQSLKQQYLKVSSYAGATPFFSHHAAVVTRNATNMFPWKLLAYMKNIWFYQILYHYDISISPNIEQQLPPKWSFYAYHFCCAANSLTYEKLTVTVLRLLPDRQFFCMVTIKE